MKVIGSGKRYILYDDDVKTYDQLPPAAYIIRCNPMSGFSLEAYHDLEIKEAKVYGVHNEKINKVMRSFGAFERSLGVILSGHKGIGKSLFTKMLGIEAIKNGIPVIFVDQYYPGIASYIESIEQEVMVLFDEFDKTFGDIKVGNGETNPQASLLGLFDGVAQGKKMYVITCNNVNKLNDYLVNRPGRFHYHFRFEFPTPMEIREYLEDKLDEKYYEEIKSVMSFASRVDLNYDCLRAIAFELNTGITFKDAIKDLNILNMSDIRYTVELHCQDGKKLEDEIMVNLFNQDTICAEFDIGGYMWARAALQMAKFQYDELRGLYFGREDAFTMDADNNEKVKEFLDAHKPAMITIRKKMGKQYHYAV